MATTPKQPVKIIKDFEIKASVKGMRAEGDRVRNKKLKNSSRQWLNRHLNDEFTQASKAMGYRARSAFKIIEVQERFKLIKSTSSVLDLGCAPGGWAEIIVTITRNTVIGIDLLATEGLSGVTFLQGDFLDAEIQKQAIALNKGKKFDAILSDIAPNTTGISDVDHLNIINILENEIIFLQSNLAEDGHFISKIFQGQGTQEIVSQLKKMFMDVKLFKPKSSRKESKEIYIVCQYFLG